MNDLEYCARLLGKDRPDVRRILENFQRDPQIRRNAEAYLLRLLEEEGGSILDLPPFTLTPPTIDGDAFLIGQGLRGAGTPYDYLIPTQSIWQDSLIAGTKGMGKTSTTRGYCEYLMTLFVNSGLTR